MEAAETGGLSVAELARRVAMSKRNSIRRFKAATGNTPLAKRGRSVDQIASRTGCEDPVSFRAIFKRVTGVSPTEYRKKCRLYQA